MVAASAIIQAIKHTYVSSDTAHCAVKEARFSTKEREQASRIFYSSDGSLFAQVRSENLGCVCSYAMHAFRPPGHRHIGALIQSFEMHVGTRNKDGIEECIHAWNPGR
jgi:hypothetical protein